MNVKHGKKLLSKLQRRIDAAKTCGIELQLAQCKA